RRRRRGAPPRRREGGASIAPAAAARLAGAAVGPLAGAARVALEPRLARLDVGHHRPAREVLALPGLDHGAPTQEQRHDDDDSFDHGTRFTTGASADRASRRRSGDGRMTAAAAGPNV